MARTMATLITWTALAAAQTVPKPVVIEHVRVFDGTRVIADTNVVVEGGVIRAMGATAPRPAGAEVVDGKGKTLLPGLIDSHTHTIGAASLEQAPIFGVTTDLDMFTDPRMAADVKKQQKEGKLAKYADLRSAGYLATAPGGHGTEYGLKVPTLTQPDEAQAWVDARIAEGSDYIKAIYDDALEYGVDKPWPTLSKATLKALADATHKRGKLLGFISAACSRPWMPSTPAPMAWRTCLLVPKADRISAKWRRRTTSLSSGPSQCCSRSAAPRSTAY